MICSLDIFFPLTGLNIGLILIYLRCTLIRIDVYTWIREITIQYYIICYTHFNGLCEHAEAGASTQC